MSESNFIKVTSVDNRQDEGALAYPGWRVAIASGLGVLVSFGSLLVYTFGIFLKPVTEEFGWSRQSASLAFGVAAIMIAICSPPLGYLLDRVRARRVILPCVAIFGCAFASLALLTRHLWHLYLIFAILGAVGSGTAHLAYTRAVSTWFDRHRGMALALVMTGGAVGAIVLPPAAQALIQSLGWRGAFAILGALVLAVGLPVVVPLVREKPGVDLERRVETEGVSVAQAMRSRAFWILMVVLFLFSIGQNGAMTHLSALLTDRGIAAHDAAIAVSLLGAASLVGRLVTGWLLDRFFAPRLAFCVLALGALGILILSSAQSLAMGSLAAILVGAAMGGEADMTPYILSRYFGLKSFSMLYGFTWTGYAVAGAIGPVLMGRAFDTTASYQALTVKLSILTLFAAGLMLLMPAYGAYSGRSLRPPQVRAKAAG
jgi:predicted MFS family arabinose efflux permease